MPNLGKDARGRLNALEKWETGINIIGFLMTFALLLSFLGLLIFVLAAGGAKALFANSSFSIDASFISFVDVAIWPVVVMAAIAFFSVSNVGRTWASEVLARVTHIKAGGYEVNFSSSGGKRIKRDIERTLKDFAEQGVAEYDRAARTHSVRMYLEAAVKALADTAKGQAGAVSGGVDLGRIRATVHMPDVVFEESLYQLLDYYPRGGGRGRRFSTRYGAIGLAWREAKSQHWNSKNSTHSSIEQLIRKWGMTEAEANHSQTYQIVMCILLKDVEGIRRGILYIDAKSASTFTTESGEEDEERALTSLIEKFDNHESLSHLAESVGKVFEDVAPSGSFVRIYN